MGMARSCHFRFGVNPAGSTYNVGCIVYDCFNYLNCNSVTVNGLDCNGCINYLSSNVYANYLDEQ